MVVVGDLDGELIIQHGHAHGQPHELVEDRVERVVDHLGLDRRLPAVRVRVRGS